MNISSCSFRAESGALCSTEQARCLNCFLLDASVLCPTSSYHEVRPVLLGVAFRICCSAAIVGSMDENYLAADRGQTTKDPVNPFVHHLELTTTYEKIKVSDLFIVGP